MIPSALTLASRLIDARFTNQLVLGPAAAVRGDQSGKHLADLGVALQVCADLEQALDRLRVRGADDFHP